MTKPSSEKLEPFGYTFEVLQKQFGLDKKKKMVKKYPQLILDFEVVFNVEASFPRQTGLASA